MEVSTRKLIDIKGPVFRALTFKARRNGVSLKRYIEDMLEKDALSEVQPLPEGVTSENVLSLIGIAKPTKPVDEVEDERLITYCQNEGTGISGYQYLVGPYPGASWIYGGCAYPSEA